MSSYTGWKFLWASSSYVASRMRQIFVVHFYTEVCFIPVEIVARHWSQMVPNKTLPCCWCPRSCRIKFVLQMQKVALFATWRYDRNASWSYETLHELNSVASIQRYRQTTAVVLDINSTGTFIGLLKK